MLSGSSSSISINLSAWIFSTSIGGTGANADASLNCGLGVATPAAAIGMPKDSVVVTVLGAIGTLSAGARVGLAGLAGREGLIIGQTQLSLLAAAGLSMRVCVCWGGGGWARLVPHMAVSFWHLLIKYTHGVSLCNSSSGLGRRSSAVACSLAHMILSSVARGESCRVSISA